MRLHDFLQEASVNQAGEIRLMGVTCRKVSILWHVRQVNHSTNLGASHGNTGHFHHCIQVYINRGTKAMDPIFRFASYIWQPDGLCGPRLNSFISKWVLMVAVRSPNNMGLLSSTTLCRPVGSEVKGTCLIFSTG